MKRERRDSRGEEGEGQGRKRNRNEREEITRIPRTGCVGCFKRQPFDMKKEKKTLVLIIAPIPKGNPSLQTSNEISASLQKLLRGNNIVTLYFTPTTKTKSKKRPYLGQNFADDYQCRT